MEITNLHFVLVSEPKTTFKLSADAPEFVPRSFAQPQQSYLEPQATAFVPQMHQPHLMVIFNFNFTMFIILVLAIIWETNILTFYFALLHIFQ